MNKSWFDYEGLKCVVLCAGRGTRILPYSLDKPKVMLQVGSKPILAYIIDYWSQYTSDFIFVVSYKKKHVIDFASRLAINSRFVEQKELRGIANAVLCARELLSERFIVVLGDCLCWGEFDFPENMEQGVGVWETDNRDDIRQSYSIEIKDGLVKAVVEKPETTLNNLCGMGFYFFDGKVFDYLQIARPSSLRNEIEITDVLQNMINAGEKVSPIFFRGNYLNVTLPEDLAKAEKLFGGGRVDYF